MTAAAQPAPDGDGRPRLPARPRPTAPEPPAYPTPGTTLTICRDYDGALWAAPLSQVEPAMLVDGLPLPTWGPAAARSTGAIELPDPRQRARWCTDVAVAASRCFQLWWGQPGGVPASHVPAWTLLHADGTVTVVDVLHSGALTDGTDLLPVAETAALVRARGWRWELITATDPSVDAQTLREIVVDAPHGVMGDGLLTAAMCGAGLPELVDRLTGPHELLWIRPYLQGCWAAEAAREADQPRGLFPA